MTGPTIPVIDLEQLRKTAADAMNLIAHVSWAWNGTGQHPNTICTELQSLLALIDGQMASPARGPDQPDLCDMCRVRDEVRTDAEGIPFCQECWDGWQASTGEEVAGE